MPSKLGPHFIGTPGLPLWLNSGPQVYKFDPSSLGASGQVPPGPLVVGKLDQLEERLNLTDWKHYKNQGGSPQDVAAHRFNAQRNIFVGANKPRVDRYLVNGRIDAWEDDNEVVPDNPDEARWYADYCIEMMRLYESIDKKRANFCFAVGTPDVRPGDPGDIWPHLLPAVRHARDHGHIIALHEYMGYEADLGVGWRQIDAQRQPERRWFGRIDADGSPDESYPYGYVVLRYRLIYDTYFRPEGLHDAPLVITECGCDSVETVTPLGGSIGTWTEHRDFWAARGDDPESYYAEMLKWYDWRLREDSYVLGATIFTVGSVGNWAKWDISGTRVEEEITRHIHAERNVEDKPVSDSTPPVIVSPTAPRDDAAEAAGFATDADLNRVPPGAIVRATWTFRNSGPTTWDHRYRLTYVEEGHPETVGFPRSAMSASSASIVELGAPELVRPGESVSLTLDFTAPETNATHATSWQLAGPDGQPFGPVRWLRAVVVGRAASLAYDTVGFQNTAGDFNNLQPGRQFSGIWTIRNSGGRTWNGDFRVIYVDAPTADSAAALRDPMGAEAAYTLRQVSGRDSVAPGETAEIRLDLVAPLHTGAYAFHWQLESDHGEPFGGIRWLRIGVTGIAPDGGIDDTMPVTARGVAFGMNINPEAHGLDVDKMEGLGWVRWVFWASRLKLSPEEAYQRKYRSLIQTYAAAGIRSLIILHQDTEWGNAPWENGGWEAYAETFAKACGRVAAVCSEFGDKVAYQIFNEQDSGPDNHSAIGIAAGDYAIVLDRAQAAIRRAHPGATVVIGGLNTGPDNAIRYVRDVQARLDGRLPVDALAVHPYGRYVKKILFNYGSIGKLSDSLNKFRKAFPNLPLWITEVGVANDTPIGPEHYADIGVYVREIVDEVADNFAEMVPVLIWFGWTDLMRHAGILTADGQPKPHVFDAFVHMRERSKIPLEGLEALIGGLESLDQSHAEFVSFATTLENHSAVPAGSTFTNTWRFRNNGATTWGEGFRLVYVPDGANSDPLMADTEFELASVAAAAPVPPGGETDVVLTMTAPAQFGRAYRSRWQLLDPEGVAFGHLFAEITVAAAPTSRTGARTAGMTFIRDHTVPDGTTFVAGTDFHKQWAVRNTGVRHWGNGFRLVFAQGDPQMARGVMAHMVPEARPDEEVILSIPMTAPPARDGRTTEFTSLWRLQDDHGAFFGDPVWAKIVTSSGVPVVDGQPPASQATALGRLLNDPTAWYSQLDGRWSGVAVGHGPQRIEAWGCLLTCMAMTLTAFGARFNPQELNTRLRTEGDQGFVGSNVQFIAPTKVLTRLNQGINLRSFEDSGVPDSQWTGEDPIGRIDMALAAGQIVLAQVDTTPNNGLFDSNIDQHWVIITQRTPSGDDYLILDSVVPADQVRDQPRSLMLKYGNRIAGQTNEENLRQAIKSSLVYWM